MKSTHKIVVGDARAMDMIADESVELIITSPPYPMIEMWDEVFSQLNPKIGDEIKHRNGAQAFELMHAELDKVWRECYRILKPGCMACINIGDAVRTLNGRFRMYSNHARVIQRMGDMGFDQLPDILWRKPTNAPNKFMGSGMLPSCAYVTYEHEYILIFRKGENRTFGTDRDKDSRRQSAFFWEERNVWFSDVWTDLKGTSQPLCNKSARDRSAAYPFELAYRIICMHTIYGDTILDPFVGTGTSMAAAVSLGRSSIGVDISAELTHTIQGAVQSSVKIGRKRVLDRLSRHRAFIKARMDSGRGLKYRNRHHDIETVTAQETGIRLYVPRNFHRISDSRFAVEYEPVRSEMRSQSEQVSLFAGRSSL